MPITQPFPGGLTSPQVWLDGVLPKVPGAALDTVKHEILTTMRDFFAFSGAWRGWVGPILLHPGATTYAVETGDIKADAVTTLAAVVHPANLELSKLREDIAGPLWEAPIDVMPSTFYNPTPKTVVFLPLVAEEGHQASLYITMQPIDLNIPEALQSSHYDAIVTGALSRLYMSKGIYTDLPLGATYAKRYNYLRAAARIAAEGNFDAPRRHASPAVPFVRPMMNSRIFAR